MAFTGYAPLPEGPFDLILADPPWAFRTYANKHTIPHRTTAAPYQTMRLGEMMAMRVRDLAAQNCALVMWVVDTHLDQSMELAAFWGFKYKTILFIWTKGHIGMGYYTRKQGEIALLFTCGKPLRRASRSVRQHIVAPRGGHSEKPEEQYNRLEALFGDCRRLELFARQRRTGWTSWGDQLDDGARPGAGSGEVRGGPEPVGPVEGGEGVP